MSRELRSLCPVAAEDNDTPTRSAPVPQKYVLARGVALARTRWTSVATLFALIMLVWIALSNIAFWCIAGHLRHEYYHLRNVTNQVQNLLPTLQQIAQPLQPLAATIALHKDEFARAIAALPTVERDVQHLVNVADDLARELAALHILPQQDDNQLHHDRPEHTLPVWREDERID